MEPLARILSRELNAIEVILLECPENIAIDCVFSSVVSHSLIVLSLEPLARMVPLLLKASAFTLPKCSEYFIVSFQLCVSHNIIVLSAEALASLV